MAIDPGTAALAQAGANVATQGLTGIFTALNNKKARKWQLQDYRMQRNDALADWRMMAEYNSPAAQMQRLKDAGLNPNLVYGSGADAQVGPVRATDTRTVTPQPLSFDAGSVLGGYYDVQLRQAQIDNLQAQKTTNDARAQLTQAQAAAALLGIDRSKLKYGQEKELYDTYLEFQRERLKNLQQDTMNKGQVFKKLGADIQYTIDQNKRQWELQKPRVAQAAEQVLLMQANKAKINVSAEQIRKQISIAEQELRIKTKQAEIWERGQNPNDPAWQRLLLEILEKVITNATKDGKKPWWFPG